MAYYQPDQNMYGQQQYANHPQSGGYDASNMQFGQYSYDTSQSPGMMPATTNPGYMGTMFTPSAPQPPQQPSSNSFDDEPPLLEELGINFDHIVQKTLVVLNPVKEAHLEVVQDTDLAGPLVFCMAFGGALMLAGKLQFGYIYGLGLVGCLAMYGLLNCMSNSGVSVACIMSTLGYCLLPMCLLSILAIVLSLKGSVGVVMTALIVLWSSVSASKLFVTGLSMDHQQILVAYPCALVYGVFALLTVF